jgi:hypothetical protein
MFRFRVKRRRNAFKTPKRMLASSKASMSMGRLSPGLARSLKPSGNATAPTEGPAIGVEMNISHKLDRQEVGHHYVE